MISPCGFPIDRISGSLNFRVPERAFYKHICAFASRYGQVTNKGLDRTRACNGNSDH